MNAREAAIGRLHPRPKTGGTSVNEMIKRLDPFGIDHVERFLNSKTAYIDQWEANILSSRLNWISGHVRLDEIARSLIWYPNYVEYYGTMREPVAQLISHVRFICQQAKVELIPNYSSESFLRNMDIKTTDFSDPYDIMRMLSKYRGFLLNNQSRTIIGEDFGEVTSREILDRIRKYKKISIERDLSSIVSAMGYTIDEFEFPELNVSDKSLDLSAFEEYPVSDFLQIYHKHDLNLYNIVSNTNFDHHEININRPAYSYGDVFSLENFNPGDYLFSCPDVEWAVQRGIISSAQDHFTKFGWNEGRRRIVELAGGEVESRSLGSCDAGVSFHSESDR